MGVSFSVAKALRLNAIRVGFNSMSPSSDTLPPMHTTSGFKQAHIDASETPSASPTIRTAYTASFSPFIASSPTSFPLSARFSAETRRLYS